MTISKNHVPEMLSLHAGALNVELAKGVYDLEHVQAKNPRMHEILELARKASESDRTTILILGESGTGKGVLAKSIHYNSPRAAMPLLELNCAALLDTLLESELFGYEAGAFTDARRRKEGLLEKGHGGTLFLDEIGNMSPNVQAKLLRVLEEGTFMRLGGTRPLKADVRIIAATNSDLKKAVAQRQFREDLFYRLNVVPITVPPLRERPEDIMPLALDMMKKYNRDLNRNFTGFTAAAAELLTAYPWPGNIRELRNVVERTIILAQEGAIDADALPEEIRDYQPSEAFADPGFSPWFQGKRIMTLEELEERYINEVLVACRFNKSMAARMLGIHPTSILRRLKKTASRTCPPVACGEDTLDRVFPFRG